MVAEVADIAGSPQPERMQNGGRDLDLELKRDDVLGVSSEEEDDDYSYDNSLALHSNQDENAPPSFGNIAVSNSSGIHVGNKNYYQGPVTIKKIIYAGAGEADVQNGVNGKCDKDKDGDNCAIDDNKVDKGSKAGSNFSALVKKLRYNKPLLITVIVCTIAIIGMVALLFLFLRDNKTKYTLGGDVLDNKETDSPLDPAALPADKVKIVTRQEWLAQDPAEPLDQLKVPVPFIILMHSATESCTNQTFCSFCVKQIQIFHMQSQNWWDIGYNFLVGGDGYVYEGRGWNSEGSHTKFYNKKSIGIAFVGTFNNYLPPKRQMDAAKNLIALGVNESYIQPDYKLLGASQLSSTQSPGQMLFDEMKTWPHWAPEP